MKERSPESNRYYWGVVIPHSSKALISAGWEPEIFNHPDLTHKFWKNILNIKTIQGMTSQQFTYYIEDIVRMCAVYLNYSIPTS